MGIVDEDVARVRESADIVAVVSERTQLRKSGLNWSGLCPFHAEKSPSFSVNADKGVYYCFGCGAGGDVIDFVREVEKTDFVGAIEFLASKTGIPLRYSDRDGGEGRRKRAKLVDAVEAAVEWYHQRLLSAPDAKAARKYLRSRQLDADTVRRYRIGWAPTGWDELVRALRLPRDVALQAGLAVENRKGGLNDFFRGRILFPIFDASGDPLGFGGRIMPGEQGPKYKNSPQGPLYDKSRVLYGLNWAKAEAVTSGEVIVCEGYTDVIAFARVGLDRAVAPCGTSLTDQHVTLLRKYAPRVVLAFDADNAGRAAAERFYAWERTHEVEVVVADLPPGVDPAEVAGDDPERLRAAVTGARPFLGFRVERLLTAGNLATPEGRAKAAEAAIAAIAEHPSPMVRDSYLMEVASRCRLSDALVREQLAQRLAAGGSPAGGTGAEAARRGAPGRGAPGGGARPSTRGAAGETWDESWGPMDGPGQASGGDDSWDAAQPVRGAVVREDRRPPPRLPRGDSPEAESLRLAIARPDEMLPLLGPWAFLDPTYLRVFRVLEHAPDFAAAVEVAGDDAVVVALLRRLAVEESTADVEEVFVRLLQRAAEGLLTELETEANHVADDPAALRVTLARTQELRLLIEDLRGGSPGLGTVEQLLAWLVTEPEEHA